MRVLLITWVLSLLTVTTLANGLGAIPVPPTDELNDRVDLIDTNLPYGVEIVFENIKPDYHYTQRMLSYVNPRSNTIRTIRLDFYVPQLNSPAPTVMLFPSLRGVSPFDTGYSKAFAKKGYNAVISHVVEDVEQLNTIEEFVNSFTDTAQDNLIVVDYLQSLSYVNPTRIAAFGVSLGGIRAALIHGVDPRIKTTGVVVGGGNLPGIVTFSDASRVVELRQRLLSNSKLQNKNRLETLLRRSLIFDPVYFSKYWALNRPIYFAIGKKDTTVPSRYQREIQSHHQRVTFNEYNSGHNLTITKAYLNKRPVLKFLSQNL